MFYTSNHYGDFLSKTCSSELTALSQCRDSEIKFQQRLRRWLLQLIWIWMPLMMENNLWVIFKAIFRAAKLNVALQLEEKKEHYFGNKRTLICFFMKEMGKVISVSGCWNVHGQTYVPPNSDVWSDITKCFLVRLDHFTAPLHTLTYWVLFQTFFGLYNSIF